MLAKLLDAVFGCSHAHYSFPRTVRTGIRRGNAASLTGTYVVCLDCGRELAYDWDSMKVINSSSDARRYTRSLVTKEAA